MDDSSPDLSLKLRRGSSDSRDSFYMDLDKGIDSDIDEMAAAPGEVKDAGAEGSTATRGVAREASSGYVSLHLPS